MVTTMGATEEQREFRLGWSLFRRAHQAVAERCHKASHRAKHATGHYATEHDARRAREPDLAPTGPIHAKEAGLLTDTEWERVREVLPVHKPGQGRPRRDDRQVLRGILWVMDTGSSWREMPEEKFGPNSTAQGRYRKWLKEGLWSRIVQALRR
jgi:hypothetical protein